MAASARENVLRRLKSKPDAILKSKRKRKENKTIFLVNPPKPAKGRNGEVKGMKHDLVSTWRACITALTRPHTHTHQHTRPGEEGSLRVKAQRCVS